MSHIPEFSPGSPAITRGSADAPQAAVELDASWEVLEQVLFNASSCDEVLFPPSTS